MASAAKAVGFGEQALSYLSGLKVGALGRQASMVGAARTAGQAGYNAGQLANYVGKTAWNSNSGRGAIIGAGVGGAYGAVSDDTSVLGGMAMGAAGGAGIGRYGGRAMAAYGTNRAAGMAGGARLSHAAASAGRLVKHDLGRLAGYGKSKYGAAKGWWGGGGGAGKAAASSVAEHAASAPAGASMASNAAVNPVASSRSPYRSVSDILGDGRKRMSGVKGIIARGKQRVMAARAANDSQAAGMLGSIGGGPGSFSPMDRLGAKYYNATQGVNNMLGRAGNKIASTLSGMGQRAASGARNAALGARLRFGGMNAGNRAGRAMPGLSSNQAINSNFPVITANSRVGLRTR